MTTSITCDLVDWPIVVVRFPPAYTDAEFAAYLQELTLLLQRGPDALIVDTRRTHPPTARQRQLLSSLAKQQREALGRLFGIALIIDSTIARYAMTAVSWLAPKPCPIEFVASLKDAEVWVARQKRAASSA